MRLCLMIEGQEGVTWDDWVRLAGLTERDGFDGLFRSDHYTAIIRPQADALDAWTTLAGLATLTQRIRLGTLVSPSTFRHPSVLARMAVTVDHISRGRVEVGIGSGWYEREHVARLPVPGLETALRALRGAGRDRRPFVDRGALRPLRARLRAPRQTALPQPFQKPHPPLVLGGTAKPRFAALPPATRPRSTRSARRSRSCASARRGSTVRVRRPAATRPRSGFSVMTACFVGADRRELLERLRAFLAIAGNDSDPDAVLASQADRWLAGTVEEVAARIEELRRSA